MRLAIRSKKRIKLLSELPPLADKVEAARSRMPARKIATRAFLDDGDRFNFRLKKHQVAPMLSKLLTQLFDLPYDTFFSVRSHFSENLSGKQDRVAISSSAKKLRSHNLISKFLFLFYILIFFFSINFHIHVK